MNNYDVKSLLLVALSAILVSLGGYNAALRKGRRPKLWMFFCLLFSPLFFLLEILPNRKLGYLGAVPSDALKSCSVCGAKMSSAAKLCPQCGHPNRDRNSRRPSAIEIVGGLSAAASLFAAAYVAVEFSPARMSAGLPRCDSNEAFHDVQTAVAGAPLGKVMGLSIVQLSNIDTLFSDERKTECRAIASLSNDSTHKVLYRFQNENDEVIVHFNLEN